MFNPTEVEFILYGSGNNLVSVSEWKENTMLATSSGDPDGDAAVLAIFWDILQRDLTNEELLGLLKFSTSLHRLPLLGFKQLDPKFTIQIDPIENHLPTAATCFNILRIPKTLNRNELKKSLLTVINESSGFQFN